MKIDNIFIVESPLQALVALELAGKFSEKKNAIYYRLGGKGREKNNEQIFNVVEMGEWFYKFEVRFDQSGSYSYHQSARDFILEERERLKEVDNIFFGEFRSHWMHVFRMSVPSNRYILLDDGAATLIVKKNFIDKKKFFPDDYFYKSSSRIKSVIKKYCYRFFYRNLYEKNNENVPVLLASPFLRDESDYKVDFSCLKKKYLKEAEGGSPNLRKAFFFGSKYSESGIVSLDYEVRFIEMVVAYYKNKGVGTVYCSHRDESDHKLKCIERVGCEEVVKPDVPAELFLLARHGDVSEISAAYSSVLSNLSLIFSEKEVTSFKLSGEELSA